MDRVLSKDWAGRTAIELQACAEAVRHLIGQLDMLMKSSDPLFGKAQAAGLTALEQAEEIYRFRRRRDKLFGQSGRQDLFGDPAWDILLDLYIAQGRGRNISVTSLCLAACVPPTTGLRWIAILTDEGWIARVSDPADKRRVFLMLTEHAYEVMTRLLEA